MVVIFNLLRGILRGLIGFYLFRRGLYLFIEVVLIFLEEVLLRLLIMKSMLFGNVVNKYIYFK